jgi:hypothetical protein
MSLSLFAMIFSNGVVEAVDNVRLRLETDSAFWFSWVKYSGYRWSNHHRRRHRDGDIL